jgi:acetyltransferase-like isoleucine patch superfamily enzyme
MWLRKREKLRFAFWTVIARAELKRKHVRYGKRLVAHEKPHIVNKGRIVIGNHTTLALRVVIHTECTNAEITIGDNCLLRGCEVYARKKVTIGNACIIAPEVTIFDSDGHSSSIDQMKRHTLNSQIKPIHIGNNVWVCARSIVLKGVTIGDNSIIGAGSIVTKDVEPNSLYAGNPAKFIRKLTD